jgi:hypothetical protein
LLFVIRYLLLGNDYRSMRLVAGKPGGWTAGMAEFESIFEPPSLPASKPQAN